MVDFDRELLESHMNGAEHEQYKAHTNKRKPDISPTLSHLRSMSPEFEAALLFASKSEKRKLRRLYWGMSKEQRQEMITDNSFFPVYGEDYGGGVQSYRFANGRVVLMRPLTPEEQEGPYPEPASEPLQTGGHILSGLAELEAQLIAYQTGIIIPPDLIPYNVPKYTLPPTLEDHLSKENNIIPSIFDSKEMIYKIDKIIPLISDSKEIINKIYNTNLEDLQNKIDPPPTI